MLSKEEQEKLHFLMNGPDDPGLQMAYTSILKTEHREKARIFEAEQRGEVKGKAEGIAVGKAQGQLIKAIEIATKMKNINKPIHEIIEFTGLTQEEIEKL